MDMDRRGDVRILENIVPGHVWLSTSLHELATRFIQKRPKRSALPLARRRPCGLHRRHRHDVRAICAERRLLKAFGADISDPEQFRLAAAKQRRNRLLVFSRFCQVMFRFEVALYDNPKQDLNKLWWDLVEKYQEIKRPEGRTSLTSRANITYSLLRRIIRIT